MSKTLRYKNIKVEGTLYGINNRLIEPDVNREASNFIAENYSELIKAAKEMGVDPCKVEDCVQDVCASIIRSENCGEGFDMNKGRTGNGIISVRQFVFGRLKGYSKHRRYQSPTESPIKDPNKTEDGFVMNEIASSFLGDAVEDMSACQKAYNSAMSYDKLEEVEATQSFEEELNYILSFDNGKDCQLSIRKFLLNIEYFKNNLEKVNIRSLFSELKGFDSDFIEAFSDIVKFSSTNPEVYFGILKRMA